MKFIQWLKSFFIKKEMPSYSNIDVILELAEEHGSLKPYGFDGDADGYELYVKMKCNKNSIVSNGRLRCKHEHLYFIN